MLTSNLIAGGFVYLGNKDQQKLFNGSIFFIAKIIKNVMSSAAEAEIAALFLNAKHSIPFLTASSIYLLIYLIFTILFMCGERENITHIIYNVIHLHIEFGPGDIFVVNFIMIWLYIMPLGHAHCATP
jgi:hypothetical protein